MNIVKVSVMGTEDGYAFQVYFRNRLVESKSFPRKSKDYHNNTLKGLRDSLRVAKKYFEVEDILVIEVHNGYVYKWLHELKAPKKHQDNLVRVISALQEIPFSRVSLREEKPTPKIRAWVSSIERDEVEGVGVSALLQEEGTND